ncbi:sigma factor [Nonomuraea diastatica]|uniref:sigma factor n=1 Tax=Nonomuraea diastatica TaxID=1848329 RepID=UPI001C704749|nr:sigma factor [Nonomuraea diastatica]
MNTRDDELAAAYEQVRPRLIRVAYAVLGSRAEAEDVVSHCWLRLIAADGREPVVNVEKFATTTVARSALDTLRSARRRRELYLGAWLPEPAVELGPTDQDPADRVTLDDTISYALLVVLETLTPAERTAWVLHDLSGMTLLENRISRIDIGRAPAKAAPIPLNRTDRVIRISRSGTSSHRCQERPAGAAPHPTVSRPGCRAQAVLPAAARSRAATLPGKSGSMRAPSFLTAGTRKVQAILGHSGSRQFPMPSPRVCQAKRLQQLPQLFAVSGLAWSTVRVHLEEVSCV